jgi:methionyl-tRNA formyltransferase
MAPLLVVDDAIAAVWAELQGEVLRIDARDRDSNGLLEALARTGITALVSVQYPWILPTEVIEAVGGRAFNLHNARLPDYRGYNSLTHEILNGESVHTVTLHWMQPQVDTGYVAYSAITQIDQTDTAKSLHQRSIPLARCVFDRLLDALASGDSIPRVEIPPGGHFYRRVEIEQHRSLSAPFDADEIARHARAFHFPPHEPAYVVDSNGRKTYLIPERSADQDRVAGGGIHDSN